MNPVRTAPVVVLALSACLATPAAGDQIVNNPGADTGNNTTQFETTLAVDDGTLCAGWLDTGPPIGTLAGYGRSGDGGASWSDRGELPQQGDPVIAAHRASNTFYYAMIATIAGRSAIGVARSTDGCQSFAPSVTASPVASAQPGFQFNDKPWIAVDNSGGPRDGHVYVCWTRFFDASGDGTEDSSELRVSGSSDGGATWQNEQVLTSSGSPFGCNIQTGLQGEVYVAWADRVGNDIWIVRSDDGGATFGVPGIASRGIVRPAGSDRPLDCAGRERLTLTGNILQAHQAWMAVDASGGPHSGDVYVAWVSDPEGLPDNADVFVARSSDGGESFARPTRIGGSGPTDQFEPNLAVGGGGRLVLAWYDRVNDPAANLAIDLYATHSLDGGRTFLPPARITDSSFPTPPLLPHYDPIARGCHWGEYLAVAADADSAYYLWTDNHGTVTNASFPAGRPDPDIYFERAALPPIPSNEFGFGKVRRNERKGTAKVNLSVPGPGEVLLEGRGVRGKSKDAEAAGKVGIPVRPRNKLSRRLDKQGSARVRVEVTYTPEFGEPNTQDQVVRLRQKE